MEDPGANGLLRTLGQKGAPVPENRTWGQQNHLPIGRKFQTHGRTLKVGLEQRLECMRSFQEIYLFWVDLVDIFIAYSAFDLLLDHEYYTTEDGRMDAWKNRLCKSLRLEEDEIIRFLYNELSPHEILSVDAVVALL